MILPVASPLLQHWPIDVGMKVYTTFIMGILNLHRAIMTVMPVPFGKLILEMTYGGAYWASKDQPSG